MKKLLSIVCCSIILLSVSSCTKQYITPNPNQTIVFDVAASGWVVSDATAGLSYSAALDVPEITDDFARFGGVLVSISYDGGSTYEQLPEVFNNTSFSYTYNNGNVTIYAQNSDGSAAVKPTDPIKVKVILVATN
jgi:hypothetical protein